MKTLTFSTGIHALSFLEDLSVRPSTVSLIRLPLVSPRRLLNLDHLRQLLPSLRFLKSTNYREGPEGLWTFSPSYFLRLLALGHRFKPQNLVTATAGSHSHTPLLTY
jgi:hypothetical protein